MFENKNQEGGGGAIFLLLILIAIAIWISFKVAKLVYQYSRSKTLAIWTFLVTAGALVVTWLMLQGRIPEVAVVLAYLCGFIPIVIATRQLYFLRKSEIDELINGEKEVEKNVSKGRGLATSMLVSAGCVYAGYKLGKL